MFNKDNLNKRNNQPSSYGYNQPPPQQYGYNQPPPQQYGYNQPPPPYGYNQPPNGFNQQPIPEPQNEPVFDWEKGKVEKTEIPPIDWDYKSSEPEKIQPIIKPDRKISFFLKKNAKPIDPKSLPELTDSFFNIKASDILEDQKSKLNKNTFKKPGSGPKRIARIRFTFDGNFKDYGIDATFSTSEFTSSIYDFLIEEIFTSDVDLRIFTPFPITQINNNSRQTLGSYGISSNIILNVNIKNNINFRPEIKEQFLKLEN